VYAPTNQQQIIYGLYLSSGGRQKTEHVLCFQWRPANKFSGSIFTGATKAND